MYSSTFHNRQRTFLSLEREILLQERYKNKPRPYRLLNQIFAFESHRETLEKTVREYNSEERARKNLPHTNNAKGAGRKGLDPVLMLRCFFLQRVLNLSDVRFSERIIMDMHIQDFLGIEDLQTDVPSAQSLWRYREIFVRKGLFEPLFTSFITTVREKNPDIAKVVIVDSTFVEAPKQRNTREENKLIKEGKGDTLWQDNPNKKRQKDKEASWTKKHNRSYYSFKAHHTVCAGSKLIVNVFTTTASVHDAKCFERLLPESLKIKILFADAGYVGERIEQILSGRNIFGMICQKGFKNKPLSDEQIKTNTQISTIRSRVEHVFGFIENSMNGSTVRSIGFMRAQANVYLTALVYNVFRVRQLLEKNTPASAA